MDHKPLLINLKKHKIQCIIYKIIKEQYVPQNLDEDVIPESDSCIIQPPPEVLNRTIKKRHITLIGEINESLALYVNTSLQFYSDTKDPVYMYICSQGGDVICGYSIIDQMELSPFPIYTIIRGQASSMAAIIAAYGTKGLRYITKNSMVMVHPFYLSMGPETISHQNVGLDYMKGDYIEKIKSLSKRTKIGYKKLYKLMEINHWMTPKQAIGIGIIDNMWTKRLEIYANKGTNNCLKEE